MFESEKYIEEKLTQLWHEVELWQRDNHYIHSGYRPESNSYLASVASLFYLHNESINVYSHMLAAMAFAIYAPFLYKDLKSRYRTVTVEDFIVFSCFFIGAIFCLSMSAGYHLISNHSYAISRFGNQLDYVGIVLLIWGSFIPSIYYGFAGRRDLTLIYWTMITLIGVATTYASLAPSFRTPEWRPVRAGLFVCMGLSAVIPVFHGLFAFGYQHLTRAIGLSWLITQGALYILGAGLYAARVPERVWPAAATHLKGLILAFDAKHQGPHAASKVLVKDHVKTE